MKSAPLPHLVPREAGWAGMCRAQDMGSSSQLLAWSAEGELFLAHYLPEAVVDLLFPV